MEKSKKQKRYERIIIQLDYLLNQTPDPLCKMSTINAILHNKMEGFFWTGFYRITEGQLRVGPYQGPLACQILEKNKGVCWSAINTQKSVIVPDVLKFPGHITCDSRSKSEIAVPVYHQNTGINAVLDIDSKNPGNFDEVDADYLEKIVAYIFIN